MIINIVQITAALKHDFRISFDNKLTYNGRLGSLNRRQNIVMTDDEGNELKAVYQFRGIINYVPFLYFFGRSKYKNCYDCYKQENKIGGFSHAAEGFYRHKFVITDDEKNNELYAYVVSKGDSHICIYIGDVQIAQVEIAMRIKNGCNEYVLYLLDEYSYLADLLSMFVLYYDNLHNTNRGEMQIGTSTSWEYSFSKYNNKFSPTWINEKFKKV